ncbi:MAG: cysteine desulfurase [Candidatus Micrarchaeota archaeon]
MNVEKIRADFPILFRKTSEKTGKDGKPVAYLDNASSSQKPRQVVEAMQQCYYEYYANVHRGLYRFSEEATDRYEKAREAVADFIGANGNDRTGGSDGAGNNSEQIIFTRNATEAINLVAYSWGEANIKRGDKIVISIMEHHSNFVPWQQLAKRKKAKLEILDIDPHGYGISESEFVKLRGAKLVAITHASNVLGTINNVRGIVKAAHDAGAVVLVDGAQSAPHIPVDVEKMGCDFFVITGHKMLGPSGIGALYGKTEILEKMPPFLYGGDMIREVRREKSTWAKLPHKFEAGTPGIAEAIGLHAAIDYLRTVGMEEIAEHEKKLTEYAMERFREAEGIKQYGPANANNRLGIIPFTIDGVHPHDVAAILDEYNVAIRSGHHCAMPLHERLGLDSTNRASFYLYNTQEEIDRMINAIEEAKKIFGVGGKRK